MSYSSDIASILAEQLARFVTLNPHQLAGHVPNLDFWLEGFTRSASSTAMAEFERLIPLR